MLRVTQEVMPFVLWILNSRDSGGRFLRRFELFPARPKRKELWDDQKNLKNQLIRGTTQLCSGIRSYS